MSSLRLEGKRASRLVGQIAAAPEGTGPNAPENCLEKYGDDVIVLRIVSASGVSFVHVRYSGCDHRGFDDGVTLRRLTRAPLLAVMADANAPWAVEGPVIDLPTVSK